MVQSQRSRALTGHLGAPIPVDFFNLRCYFLKSIKKSTSFNIFLPATNHNLFSFPFWYKENVYLTEFKGTIRFQFFTHPVLQPSKLFLFNSALLLINPSGNISNKNKKKCHIHYPPNPAILPWEWPEGAVNHLKRASQQVERDEAAGCREPDEFERLM